MHSITLIGHQSTMEFAFPATWDEVRPEALIPIARAQVAHALLPKENGPERTVAEMQQRKHLLQQLAGIPEAFMEAIKDVEDLLFEVDTTDYHTGYQPIPKSEWRLLPQLDWALQPPQYHTSLLPRVECNGTVWIGPDDHLDSMTLLQWTWAANLNRTFKGMEGEDRIEYFHRHLACLYTPEGMPWSNLHIEAHAALIRQWPEDLKLAALLNYEAIQSTLPTIYKRVYDPSGDAAQSPLGVFGMAYDVAKSGVFGPKKTAEQERVHDVLGYMEHTLFQDEEAEKKAKRNARKRS